MKLEVEKLTFSYGDRQVLKRISFETEPGEFLAVLGPNGVGKSTLFRCLLGNLPEYGGRICLDGREIRDLGRREMAKRIAYIPQIHRPTFGYTVLDTVLMGVTGRLSPFTQPGKHHVALAMEMLEQMGVAQLRDRNFGLLSGGEQQLVLVARAMAQKGEILIMDEPTSSLDYGNQHRVLQKVKALTKKGYTVILSTHNPQQGLTFGDRILALTDGQIGALGASEQVLTEELMHRLYGIDVAFEETNSGTVLVPKGMGGEG